MAKRSAPKTSHASFKLGRTYPTRTPAWEAKRSFYKSENVWVQFVAIKSRFQRIFTDGTGYVNHERAHSSAQAEMDCILSRKKEGENIQLVMGDADPGRPGHLDGGGSGGGREAEKDGFFVPASRFEGMDTLEYDSYDITRSYLWVFHHLGVSDVRPEDAPDPGTYLMWNLTRSDNDRIWEFMRTVMTKLLPSKQQIEDRRKLHDDGSEILGTLERIEREVAGDQDEVSDLYPDGGEGSGV